MKLNSWKLLLKLVNQQVIKKNYINIKWVPLRYLHQERVRLKHLTLQQERTCSIRVNTCFRFKQLMLLKLENKVQILYQLCLLRVKQLFLLLPHKTHVINLLFKRWFNKVEKLIRLKTFQVSVMVQLILLIQMLFLVEYNKQQVILMVLPQYPN